MCAIVAYDWLLPFLGMCVLFGFMSGALMGFSHDLPIRPWMCLTHVDGGMYFEVKKKQQCPCIYWGKYCTEMHEISEVFVVFTNDDVKFVNYVKNAAGVMAGV